MPRGGPVGGPRPERGRDVGRGANVPQVSETLAGHPNIAAATRYHTRDATRTLATLGLTR